MASATPTPTGSSSPSAPPLVFKRLGGGLHLWVEGADALGRLDEVDPSRWAVTSLPLADVAAAAPELAPILDPGGSGRLRVDQLLAARDWLFRRLRGRGGLAAREAAVDLAALDTSHEEGAALHRTARRVAEEMRGAGAARVALEDLNGYRAAYVHALANGDGIVPPEFLGDDEEVARLARDVMAAVGSSRDLSGLAGVGTAELATFRAEGARWLAWRERGRTEEGLAPLGEATGAAVAAIEAVEEKLRQYFLQCDLLHEEPAVAGRFRLDEEEAKAFDVGDPAAIAARLRGAPLATPRADGVLDLEGPVNPAWAAEMGQVRRVVVGPVAGEGTTTLTRATWEEIAGRFAAWRAWRAEQPSLPFEALGEERVREVLGGDAATRLEGLIAADLAAAPEIARLADLERLLLLHRWIVDLANSVVGLASLHDARHRPLFEAGSLVIDGRRLDFTMRVADRTRHRAIATEARIFLVYARLTDREGGDVVMEVAAPVTRGERGRLAAGKRGVFYARDGRVLDAEVVEIVEHAISIAEAVRAPFRHAAAFVRKKVAALASAKMPEAQARAQKALADAVASAPAVGAAGTAPAPPAAAAPPTPAAPKGPGLLQGGNLPLLLIGGGAVFAALVSALTYVATQLAKVRMLDFAAVVLTVLAVVVAVAALVGWFKLRTRDLAPLFEANGWAVNARLSVSGRMARLFNRRPPLPRGHRREMPSMAGFLPDETDAGGVSVARVVAMLLLVLLIGALVFYYVWWPDLQLAEREAEEEAEAVAAAMAPPAPDPLKDLAGALRAVPGAGAAGGALVLPGAGGAEPEAAAGEAGAGEATAAGGAVTP